MSTSAHSRIGASSLYRWSKCPGSVRQSEGIKSVSSAYAEEGTHAHTAAAFFLEHNGWPEDAPKEMIEAVKVYTSTVLSDLQSTNHEDDEMLIEHRFDLSRIHPGMFGTADCVIYHSQQKLLRVYDYKHGQGLAVEVKDNPQLMYYGLGALLSNNYKAKEVELIIVQPRCPHPDGSIRRWRFPAIELLDFAADLAQFARATEEPNAPLVAGEWCRFCPAAPACPQLQQDALTQAAQDFSPVLSYDPEKLAKALSWLPTVEGWAKSVREFAYAEAMKGNLPPGYKLVQKRVTRRWRNEDDAAKFIFDNFGLQTNDIYNMAIKSPAQIEKLLDKDAKRKLNQMISAESQGHTLVASDDPRPEVKPNNPVNDFTIIES